MAFKKVTLKRYDGTENVDLFPTTTVDQIISEGTGAAGADESLSQYLDSTFINLDEKGAAGGVATLDSNQKLTPSQLPDYVFSGGIEFRGVVDLTNGKTVDDIMDVEEGTNTNFLTKLGDYLQVSGTGVLNDSANTWTATILPPGDEGDYTFPVTLESGDWITVNEVDYDTNTVTFAIVNNTFKYASTTERGIVRLTDAADVTDLTNGSPDVVTEDFMFDNVVTGELNGGANGANDELTGLAGSDHIHDGRYFTETELEDFFEGNISITGYNKANWDTAYDDKINSASFENTDGVLTLTQQDASTITVDLDGRYAESITAAQTDSTDGIDIVQTGDSYTVAHHDTSSQADVTNTNGNVIQSADFDTFGHVTSATSVDLDGRYYTETEINDWLDGPVNGTAIDGHFFTEILYGDNLTASVAGTILIEED